MQRCGMQHCSVRLSYLLAQPIASAPPEPPSPMTTEMMGTRSPNISRRLYAMASPCDQLRWQRSRYVGLCGACSAHWLQSGPLETPHGAAGCSVAGRRHGTRQLYTTRCVAIHRCIAVPPKATAPSSSHDLRQRTNHAIQRRQPITPPHNFTVARKTPPWRNRLRPQ